MDILSPVWPSTPSTRPPKKRPQGLQGTAVALVDDNLDIPFTTRLEALLTERFGAKVRRFVKPSGTAPSPAALIDDVARESDAAIVGIAL